SGLSRARGPLHAGDDVERRTAHTRRRRPRARAGEVLRLRGRRRLGNRPRPAQAVPDRASGLDRVDRLSLNPAGLAPACRLPRAATPSLESLQPGSEEALDLPAAARPFEPGAHGLSFDDDERRHRPDREALDEVRPFLLVDAVELERAVVAASLEHLGEEPFDAATGARDR